jgi:hypothetical protein
MEMLPAQMMAFRATIAMHLASMLQQPKSLAAQGRDPFVLTIVTVIGMHCL